MRAILQLNLRSDYFAAMAAGTKIIEYRDQFFVGKDALGCLASRGLWRHPWRRMITDQEPKDPVRPTPAEGKSAAATPSTELETEASNPEESEVSKLSADEQMALFENNLKEDDWGHQPC